MARFIAQLLIISLLTINIAWASDECAFTALGNASDMFTQTDDESPPVLSNANFDCDDWCHAWANPAAMLGTIIPYIYTSAGSINGGYYTFSFSSRPIPPPFHPPIA